MTKVLPQNYLKMVIWRFTNLSVLHRMGIVCTFAAIKEEHAKAWLLFPYGRETCGASIQSCFTNYSYP